MILEISTAAWPTAGVADTSSVFAQLHSLSFSTSGTAATHTSEIVAYLQSSSTGAQS
jgi:hypothetical protein